MDPVSAARDELERRIATLEGEAKALEDQDMKKRTHASHIKSQLNCLLPIFQLPNEVLQRIFQNIRAACEPADYGPIISVTLVCRHWRDVATNQRELWSHITDDPRDFVPILLERSKSSRLTVGLRNPPPRRRPAYLAERAIWKAVRERIDRVESLDIARPWDFLVDYVHHLWPKTIPILQALSLTNLSDTTSAPAESTELPFQERESLKKMPQLRSLKLVNCGIGWNCLLLRNLTVFHIANRVANADRVCPAAFLDALEGMKQLADLNIDITLPSLLHPKTRNRMVALNCLESLKITGRFNECHQFLERILIPETTVVRVCCYEETDVGVTANISLVPQRLTGSPSASTSRSSPTTVRFTRPKLRSLEIFSGWEMNEEGEPKAEYYAWPERIDFSLPLPNRHLCYEVPQHFGMTGTYPLLRSLDLANIVSLSLKEWRSDFAEIGNVLDDFEAVEDLFVTEPTILFTMNVVQEHTTEVLGERNNGVFETLPKLKNITFGKLVFKNPSLYCCPQAYDTRQHIGFQQLWDLVDGREKLGAKIETIQFLDCWNLSVEQVEKLKTAVGKVIWSGTEQWLEPMLCTKCKDCRQRRSEGTIQ
ncbi:hypothetical protein CC1G_04054 [Coprinopsis cinerea okayama7|uniref:F-box domain-containing protein n=1 Tax=Coprinopsis cinerea (strain Okayama-7 / 130 / ATCC MYA-4618 / FGSC 9003) TaxID=240176 RepID=A8NVR9_COPC7|nr:hypothetical protein CC1G_04054 [Coprinopsis cinerea okayama7\|eukprot:XP_001836741.1 hypothetical protein CC1G_04054 [Coprinopsis cinerea okayama7\